MTKTNSSVTVDTKLNRTIKSLRYADSTKDLIKMFRKAALEFHPDKADIHHKYFVELRSVYEECLESSIVKESVQIVLE